MNTDNMTMEANAVNSLEHAFSEPFNTIDNNNRATLRFSGAEWFDKVKNAYVTLAGLGGIGSFIAFNLSRLNIRRLVMYDDDLVSDVNMAGQMFKISDIDKYKTTAVTDILKSYSNFYNYYTLRSKYNSTSNATDIMICGFDNMKARKVFFTNWEQHLANVLDKKACLFIDGRLAAEEFQIICITGDNEYAINKYKEEYLFDDDEAEQTVCSYKQTTFCAMMIGALITNLFVNFCNNQISERLYDRDLPFITHYDASEVTLRFKN